MHTFQITTDIQRNLVLDVVPRAGVEPARPCGHYALNVARLPFRHLGNLNPILIDDPQSTPKMSNASRLMIASISSSGIPGR